MSDQSFLYFTQDKIIEKMDIDPRLVESFKRVMNTMQEYFNAKGYIYDRNFKQYIQQYLIDDPQKFQFYIKKLDNKNVGGYYFQQTHGKFLKGICINESKLSERQENLDSTLCHEFIHFLVMHGLTLEKVSQYNTEILYGGFINEALTEMLNQQMYPESNAYDAQVSLMEYANLLSGQVNNYRKFLNGFVDARNSGHDWTSFRQEADKFQDDFDKEGYINLIEARNNKHFIEAQRKLINLYIEPTVSKNFEEYLKCIEKLSQRPVLDEEFINTNVILKMEQNIIKSLNLNNYYLNVFLQSKLEEARKLVIENKKYNKRVYEFEFAGRTLAIDDNFNLLGNIIGITRQWDPRTGIMTLKFNGQSHTLNVNEIDFNVREEQIQNRLKELSLYFSQNSVKDLSMISQALEQTGELTKIEKFTLPIIGSTGRKKPYVIYVATYNNKIILLNNYEEIGRTENVSLNRYVGMTSSDPKVSAIYSENIGVLNDGMIFTTLPAKLIQNKALDILAGRIKETISQQDLDIEIQKYKTSENYIDEEEFEVVNETLRSLASQKFKQLSSEEKQELFEQVKKQSDKFIVSMKNGTIDVATLFGDKNIISFEAKRQILYNSQGIGIYNEFCKEIAKTNVTKKKGGKVMNTVDGNIIYSQTPQQLYEEAWYNRKKYADAIEELMMNREKYSEVEYKQRLTKLMQNRDAAQQVMSKYFNQVSQKSFTHAQQENLQSQSTQQSFDTKTYEEKMRKDYGYEDMTDDERVEFDAKLEETKRKSDKSSSEKDKLIILKEEILKHGQVPNLDEILRQLELDERQRKELEQLLREQEENIECTNRTFH